MNRIIGISFCFFILLMPWAKAQEADRVFINGEVLSCDAQMTLHQAVAVLDGKLVAVGTNEEVRRWIGPKTLVEDLGGQTLLPGFCDSHLHLVGLGESLQRLDLRQAKNWSELVEVVAEQAKKTPKGTWIDGRGWHQSKWTPQPEPNIEGYPLHRLLSQRVPDHPVILVHASGHACLANAAAMKLAEVTEDTENPDGGEIVRDAEGQPTGIFRENAQRLIYAAFYRSNSERTDEAADRDAIARSVDLAARECLKYGITSVHDAGSSFAMARTLATLADEQRLAVRVYVMIREGSGSLLRNLDAHRMIDRGNGFLTVRSVKVSIDGALGAHGAWLLAPYDDLPSSVGLNTVDLAELDRIANLCQRKDWQLCVHAIGDRANRETLLVVERMIQNGLHGDHRWRIEHAQHIDPADLPRFAKLGVIPVMQANHCTSDAPFVLARLGQRRAAEGAYRWRALIDSGVIVPNGTDAPVELVDPRASLYASVTRKLANGDSFFPNECMSRTEALLSYTLWPAMAAFQEKSLGSIEVGKQADFAIWDTQLLECPDEAIQKARVWSTWVNGQKVYDRP